MGNEKKLYVDTLEWNVCCRMFDISVVELSNIERGIIEPIEELRKQIAFWLYEV